MYDPGMMFYNLKIEQISKDRHDLHDFLTRRLGYKFQKHLVLPETLDGINGIIVTASPEGGLFFFSQGGGCRGHCLMYQPGT